MLAIEPGVLLARALELTLRSVGQTLNPGIEWIESLSDPAVSEFLTVEIREKTWWIRAFRDSPVEKIPF